MQNKRRRAAKQAQSVSLSDVAEHAGVSTATVSRYLNDPHLVRESRREVVRAAIDALGYIPHGAARALASNRTRTIGAIVPTLDNAIFAKGIQFFQEELQHAGYTLFVATSNYALTEELARAESLIERGADAMLLVGLSHDTKLIDRLRALDVPFVSTWAYAENTDQPCVGFNNHKASELLVNHLLELGHKQFGIITANTKDNDRAQARVMGAQETLQKASLQVPEARIITSAYDLDEARLAMSKLLEQSPRPTALICGNDVLAYGAITECEKRGLRVPEDVSVVGFDDLPMSRHIRPQLTTIRVPSENMGRQAARYLLDQLAGVQTPHTVELDVELIIRHSTAALKS